MIVAGFAIFLSGIAAVTVLLLWLCSLATALCLIIAAFAGVRFGVTGVAHHGWIASGYLGYAAMSFVVASVFGYRRSEFTEPRPQRARPSSIGWVGLARDADDTSTIGHQRLVQPR